MNVLIVLASFAALLNLAAPTSTRMFDRNTYEVAEMGLQEARFNPERVLLALHYDHAPDKDDGHSAAADRTVLQTLFGVDWLRTHVVAVSGAYGENADTFDADSDAVMDATWGEVNGWISAHTDWEAAVDSLARLWLEKLSAGGDVWIKEGGQSDITAAVVARVRDASPNLDARTRIHVVQHSTWNEDQSTDAALEYTRQHTDYIRIRDANAYLNTTEADERFIEAARTHPAFGPAWQAAFQYFDPRVRLDFSDTGELFYILGLGELGLDEVRDRFLIVD